MTRPTIATAIVVLLTIPVAVAIVALTDPGGLVLVLSYGVPGLVLAIRRPGQPIAWCLVLMAIGLALGTTHVTATYVELMTGTPDPLGAFTAWANGAGWVFVSAGLAGLVFVFPSGDLPSGRWRIGVWLAVALFVPVALVLAVGPVMNVTLPGLPYGANVPNPFALAILDPARQLAAVLPLLWAMLFAPQALAAASLFARFRRSTGLERLQYRWLAWAVALVCVAVVAWAVLTNVVAAPALAPLAMAIVLAAYPAVPAAVLVAVLRYRLYEIDRLVSRSLGWGIATAAVIGMFVVVVLGLQAALFHVTQGQTLAVAASTLLAFAAFQPVRSRVQAIVDRRFDRPRLEAERRLAEYGGRLQHEVDLATLTHDVETTVDATLRPASARLWIRPARLHGS